MITEQTIIDEEKLFQDITFRINYLSERSIDYSTRKIKDEKVYGEYKKAVEEFHQKAGICEYFNIENAFDKIKKGDHAWISQAILYLEVDPFYFRSGYFKEKILDTLKSAPLNIEEKSRIQKMLIGIIKKCFRREMKYYGKLAKTVADDSFRDKLLFLKENEESSSEVKTRAEYILQFISKP